MTWSSTRLVAAGVEEVKVRSVLTCESKVGTCAACYGRSLATGKLVDIGEAVGIIAAQSIGEPGTQLTMRTFHTGGVAGDDITQGLPRVVELFEARTPKGVAPIAEATGRVAIEDTDKARRIMLTPDDGSEEHAYPVSKRSRLLVSDGDHVEVGTSWSQGAIDPKQVLRILGPRAVQMHLVDEVQQVYRQQGVSIHDKHIEVIVRQMLRRITIIESGDADLLPGELAERGRFETENRRVVAEGGTPASGRPELMGITKASLATDSWLSAASFQETTRVLTEAAMNAKSDPLLGLKENVILGKLIPAGTGLPRYRNQSRWSRRRRPRPRCTRCRATRVRLPGLRPGLRRGDPARRRDAGLRPRLRRRTAPSGCACRTDGPRAGPVRWREPVAGEWPATAPAAALRGGRAIWTPTAQAGNLDNCARAPSSASTADPPPVPTARRSQGSPLPPGSLTRTSSTRSRRGSAGGRARRDTPDRGGREGHTKESAVPRAIAMTTYGEHVPTINQLVRKGRQDKVTKTKTPALKG